MPVSGGSAAGRHLVYLVAEDWYFRHHFLATAEAAIAAGWRVSVLCRTGGKGDAAARAIAGAGVALHAIPFERSSLDPRVLWRDYRIVADLYRALAPDLVHHVALKPILVGQWAARAAGIAARVSTVPGFGFVFASPTLKARVLRPFIRAALSRVLRGETGLTVLNRDDRDRLAGIAGVSPDSVTVMPGVGVDLDRFQPAPEPRGPVVATYLGRMLTDKGVEDLVEAARRLRQQGSALVVRLVGEPDPANPASIPEQRLADWAGSDLVLYQGWRDDLDRVWAESHIAVLPSHGEGFGMSLAEAAAAGRPLVATDVPGCREAVVDGETGILVPPRDPRALAAALERLAQDPALRARMGAAARRDAERRLSVARVTEAMLAVYERTSRRGPV